MVRKGDYTYSDEELLNYIRKFYEKNNIVPGRRDFTNINGYPSHNVYLSRFGTWNNGIRLAGLTPLHSYNYDDEYLKNEVFRFIDENGKVPGRRSFTPKNGYPSYSVYIRKYGSWDKYLENLGVKILEYTEEILLNDLKRFYNINNRIPLKMEMCTKNGFIPFKQYLKFFESWETALYKAGLTSYDYTDESLFNILKNFYKKYKRSPNITDLINNKDNPPISIYLKKYGTWNNTLILAGLPINQIHESLDGTEVCSICGNDNCKTWSIVDGNRICNRCVSGKRKYYHGILEPDCATGFGILMERVVYDTLKDCILCNIPEHFNYKYDLISEKYGTINVKSSKLHDDNNNWGFSVKKNSMIPDYFILIGLDKNKIEIQHVWIIPGINDIKNKGGFWITNSEYMLTKLKLYEVDQKPYNEVYQNLDIYSLPEFCNLNKLDEVYV